MVTTTTEQVIFAVVYGINQGNSLNAAPGCFPDALVIDRDDECWFVILPHEAGGDDPYDARMPGTRAKDNYGQFFIGGCKV